MSPVIFACVICGYAIDGFVTSPEKSWLKEFRALYSSHEEILISGVGCYDDPYEATWTAPPSPSMRWDDHDYTKQPSDEIPVMGRRPENGRHGFVFHDACWCVLERAIKPDNILLDRLFKICQSLPFPIRGIGVSWGHDYGGLNLIDDQDNYPWEDRLVEQYSYSEDTYQYAKYNPYDVPEIQSLLTMRSEGIENYQSATNYRNYFSMFPWEIREAIAIYLPTKDVLSLLQSSKAYLPLLTSQTFWASRFRPGSERDYVFEAIDKKPDDWINFYRMTSYTEGPPGLRNRKRIWTLIQGLRPLLQLHSDDGSPEAPNPDASRLTVAGDIRTDAESNYLFYEGCRLHKKQSAFMPKELAAIAFSVIVDGKTEYLCGMRFISKKNASISLGYRSLGKEAYLNITALKGFILAIGSRGIHALRVLDPDGGVSRWIGYPKDSPVTKCLECAAHITALEIGLDGYKAVSLSIVETDSTGVCQPIPRKPSLRQTAFWYPDVHPSNLCLNEQYFTGESPLTSGYQPLFWVHFGGPNGVYLRSLTEICVTRFGDLGSIEFRYENDSVQTETQKLGRRRQTDFSDTTRFSIDGPGGELITSVETSVIRRDGEYVFRFYRHGKLDSLKFSTNRGRSVHFQYRESSDDSFDLKPISITPGTVITGLYASQYWESGIISLGVISEAIC